MGMSHHGLQVLYSLMNEAGWACERPSRPLPDFEAALREHGLPLYGLETFTPLNRFDVLGFTLQYEIGYSNILTMLDLGGIPLHAEDRGPDDTLVIAGGPGAQNPELIAPFIDLFVLGDGEPSLPVVCERWKAMQGSGLSREDKLAEIAGAGRLGLRPPVLRADLQRGRRSRSRPSAPGTTSPSRSASASTPTSTPSPCRRGRSCRSSRRRTTGSPSRSCAAAPGSAASARARSSSDRSATARSRRSSRPPSRPTATPDTTRSACSRSRPAITRNSRSW